MRANGIALPARVVSAWNARVNITRGKLFLARRVQRWVGAEAEVRGARLFGPMTMDLNLSDDLEYLMYFSVYDPEVAVALRTFASPGSNAVDVGANIGYFTLLLAWLTGPRGTVAAFEPYGLVAERLNTHVRMNNLQNVTVYDCALSDSDGVSEFLVYEGSNHGLGSLRPRGSAPAAATQCRVKRLDTLVESGEMPPPDLVKIDVEGAEPAVLAGASRSIAKSRPVIVCEAHPLQRENYDWPLRRWPNWGREAGYRVYWPNRHSPPSLLEGSTSGQRQEGNLLLLPVEREKEAATW